MFKRAKIVTSSNSLFRDCVLAITIALGFAACAPSTSAAEVVRFEVTIARASRSGSGIDKRLAFAKGNLLRYGFSSASYVRGYRFPLADGKAKTLSIGHGISGLITLKGVLEKSDRVQYSLAVFSGKKKQADAVYSISRKGGTGIAVIDQPGGWAYVLIVKALK